MDDLKCPNCHVTWPWEEAHGVHGQCPRCETWLIVIEPGRLGRPRRERFILRAYNLNPNGLVTGIHGGMGHSIDIEFPCPFCGIMHRHGWRFRTDTGPEYRVAHCGLFKIPHWPSISKHTANQSYVIRVANGVPYAEPA